MYVCMYVCKNRHTKLNAKDLIYAHKTFSVCMYVCMYVCVSLQQLERQYSITDRERMEAVFNHRQLQQALDTAQVRGMYVCTGCM